MRVFSYTIPVGVLGILLTGCTTTTMRVLPTTPPKVETTPSVSPAAVVRAQYLSPPKEVDAAEESEAPPKLGPISPAGEVPRVGLPDLIALSLEHNPRLAKVGWAVETARGRAQQAGLYPNPTVNVTGNEISDRTGPSGIWSAYTSQELVTANKLGLSEAAALKEVDQATLNIMTERYRVFTEIRQVFFEAVTLQRRADILTELVKLADQSVENAKRLVKAKEAAELDVVQLEVDQERYRADLEATQRALPAAYKKLAASVGFQELRIARLEGDLLTPLPEYDLERVHQYILGVHPEIRSAHIGVERARLVLRRAEVEPIPNLTVGTGYTYQGQNRSNDWDVGVSVPIPAWNRNQGNIFAAKAQIQEAMSQIGRVQNDISNRLASSFSTYAAARKRAERYRTSILPKAERTYQLSLKAYQGGQFEYLRVLAAQRGVAEANLELIRSLGEMWQAGSEIAGLMLEDQWPLALDAPTAERKVP